MKELIQSINTGAERVYTQTRGKYTLSLDMIAVLQEELEAMLEDIETAKKEAAHLYEKKRG